jgi:Zn-dependent peptidase ImmA (M78 family)/DNA-binding XRE family transcriptional regulator
MLPVSERFSGQRLQLAREFRGRTQKQLGDDVAASHALISQYEAGKKKDPSPDLGEALGSVLGFEPEFFYQPIVDIFREEECSFRHRRTAPERLKSRVRAHATLIGMVIERLRTQFRFPKLDLPKANASSEEEIELAAERSRQHWGISLDGPILQIARLLERAGVVVVPHLVDSVKIDAFSRNGRTTLIFLNKAIPSTSRWTFDIGHECGHLIMHNGIHTGTEETERAADRFASALLMPRRAFAREFQMEPFSWNHIFELKKRWRVSAAAIVRRSYDLRLIGAVTYRRAFQYMSAQGWRTKGEPHEPEFQEPELLGTAIGHLGSDVELTIDQLCHELHFTAETFYDVTGVRVPEPERRKPGVIQFPNASNIEKEEAG